MFEPPLAAATPTWVWAALVTGAFVAGSVLTMWLTRFPVRRRPPAGGRDWEVVRVAPDQLSAEMWVELLREAGLPAAIRPSDAVSFLGVSGTSCRVMVPASRRREAESLLAERLDGRVAPGRNGGA